jgi:hypothetical protein
MMIPKRSRNHLRMHITTQAKLEPQFPFLNLVFHIIRNINHMSNPIWIILQQSPQLIRRGSLWSFREVNSDFDSSLLGFLKCRSE